MSLNTTNNKKRARMSLIQSHTTATKRRTTQQSSNDTNNAVPQISGISPEVVPLLLHAIKSQKKHLKLTSDHGDHADELLQHNQANNSHTNSLSEVAMRPTQVIGPKESIMARIEQTETCEKQSKRKESQIIADESLDRLLQALPNNGNIRIQPSVIIACLEFVHDMAIDKKCKTLLRRSAICVMGSLLDKFALCRSWFCDEGTGQRIRLLNYCVALKQTDHTNQRMKEECSSVEWMQREALLLLHSLANRYGHRQSKWIVATRYMEEQNGISLSTHIAGCGSVGIGLRKRHAVDRRRVRDIAIKYAEREHESVMKILNRADECFQVLVPRFGSRVMISRPSILAQTPSTQLEVGLMGKSTSEEEVEEEEEEEQVDWEDGDDTNDMYYNNGNQELRQEDHKTAVERTLAVMAHTGAISEGGLSVDINIDSNIGISGGSNTENGHGLLSARTALNRCVELLTKRHAPRLADWTDALLNSDNMTDCDITKSANPASSKVLSSLVLLPPSIRIKKGLVIQMLMDLKRDLVQTLTSAARVGLVGGDCPGQDTACSSIIPSKSTNNLIRSISGNNSESNFCKDSAHSTASNINENNVIAVGGDSLFKPWQNVLGIKSSFSKDEKDQRVNGNGNNNKKHGHGKLKIKLRTL